MLSLLLVLLGEAHADCPDPAVAVASAREATLALKDTAAAEALATAELGLSCGPWATPDLLGHLWLVEGARAALAGKSLDAEDAFSAAARVAPGLWDADLGPELKRQYDAAAQRAAGPPGELRVKPELPDLVVRLDGQVVAQPAVIAAGLHLVQVGPANGPVIFGRLFLQPADEILTVDSGISPDWTPMDVPEADRIVARAPGAPPKDPALAAAAVDLRKKATRAWGDIESATRGTDPRAERMLRDYVKRYKGATVGSGANAVEVDIPQVREAEARLAALPAAREREAAASASEDALQASLKTGAPVEEEPEGLGLSQLYLGVAGGWTAAGETDAGALGYSGLGPRLALGADARLAGPFGARVELAWQGLFAGPQGAPELGVDPTRRRLSLREISVGGTWKTGRVRLAAGGVWALGSGTVPAASAYAEPEAWALPPQAPVAASVRAGGAWLAVSWSATSLGPVQLSPAVRAGALTDLERTYPWAGAGIDLGWRP